MEMEKKETTGVALWEKREVLDSSWLVIWVSSFVGNCFFFFSFHFPFLHLNDAGEDHVISKPKQRSSDSGALLLYLTYKKVVMSQFFFSWLWNIRACLSLFDLKSESVWAANKAAGYTMLHGWTVEKRYSVDQLCCNLIWFWHSVKEPMMPAFNLQHYYVFLWQPAFFGVTTSIWVVVVMSNTLIFSSMFGLASGWYRWKTIEKSEINSQIR